MFKTLSDSIIVEINDPQYSNESVGHAVGCPEGLEDGWAVGCVDGAADGGALGCPEGRADGWPDG